MYVVFDVGASTIKYAWMTAEGKICEKGNIPTPNKVGDGMDDFLEAIGGVYDIYKSKDAVDGIAMGLPGQVDVEQGIVYGGGGIRYTDRVNVRELISNRCDGINVSLENDAKCAALAEVWLGNAKDVNDACVLVFGTGIGGAVIKDRKVHRGKHMLAGEVSFCLEGMQRKDLDKIITGSKASLSLAEENERMPFVQAAKCSAFGLSCRVAKAKGVPVDDVNGKLIYQWAKDGDAVVHEVLEDVYFDIAKLCMNIFVVYDPEIILIGGGISEEAEFMKGIQKYVTALTPVSSVYNHIKLDLCKFRNDSNLYGALYNFKQMYYLL